MAQHVAPKARERLGRQAGQQPGDADGARDRDATGGDRPGRADGQDRAGAGKDYAGRADAQDRAVGDKERPDRPAPGPAGRDNALSGTGRGNAERALFDRGQASRQATARPMPPPTPMAPITAATAAS
jgi:hypothetical protein